MDKSTVGGILLAVAGIAVGLVLEGGRLAQVLQPTAAMIVFGGTLGAVMVQFPLSTVLKAAASLKYVFVDAEPDHGKVINELLRYAHKARREGMLSLDGELAGVEDPFLRKSLTMAVDGMEPSDLRRMMNLELDTQAETDERLPRVFESAGGFAPTIGIVGAVLGLIQVMQHLENISEVGKGIAVAFVATIYGVATANILFLPWAGKLRLRQREQQRMREMMLEAVASILEGMNPRILENKLQGYANLPMRPPLQKVASR